MATATMMSTEAQERARYWLSTAPRFIQGFLRAELWDKQIEIVESVFANVRTSVKACHASGKTFVAAAIGLAFVTRYTEAVVVTTAPTWGQVEKLMWGEVHGHISRSIYPWPKALTTQLKLGPKRYMYGMSTSVEKEDEGVKFQGIHAENVLIIIDEAPGVDPKILEAAEAALSSGNAHMLKIGNPTIGTGPFADDFKKNRGLVSTHTISAFDTPNLRGLTIEDLVEMERSNPEELQRNPVPYLISRAWVLAQYKKYGKNHLFYRSRVEGEFPDQDEHSLFSLAKMEAARERRGSGTGRGLVGGLDVAGPGENATVLILRDGPDVVLKMSTPDEDPRGKVAAALMPFRERVSNINVDSVGIGEGMYQHLNDLGWPVTRLNVGVPADDTEKFANRKAELYWGLHDRLEEGDLGGLDDDLIAQLSVIRYDHTPRGQVRIESKEDLVKRGIQSPDEAEALMLSYVGGQDVWEKL